MLLHANNFEAYELGTAGWISLKALEGWVEGDVGTPDVCSIVEPGWHSRRALHVPSGGAFARFPITQDNTISRVLCFQGAFKLAGLSTTALLFGWHVVTLSVNANGSLTIDDIGVGGPVTSAAGVVKAGAWHYLEVRASMGSSDRMLVRVDGVTVFDSLQIFTGTGTSYAANLYSGPNGCTWSEPIVMNGAGPKCNGLLGVDARLALLLPFTTYANTGFSWSPSSAPLHSMIDDPLPGPSDDDATEVTAAVAGAAFLVTFGSPPAARSYEAVTALIEGVRSDSGAPTFDVVAISINTSRESAQLESSAGVKALARVTIEIDPKGGKPWTRKAIAALLVGSTTATPPI